MDQERLRGLLSEGWKLLARGEAREAALVFGRVALVEPNHPEARRGLEAAQAAVTETHRRLDERLDDACRAADRGDAPSARRLLEEVVASGGDRDRAHALLDRIDSREGRLEAAPASSDDVETQTPAPSRPGRWSRRVFAAACLVVFAVLGGGVASTWDGLLARLAQTPAPQAVDVVTPAASVPSSGERALADAQRLLDAGDPAGAAAALDAVSPQEPAYPLARRLRSEASRALTARAPVRRPNR